MKSLARSGCVAAAAVAVLSASGGMADADNDPFKGLTYAKASEMIAQNFKGVKVVVASVVGSRLTRDECTIDHSTTSDVLDGTGKRSGATFLLYLNCNDALATAGAPGGSAADPANKPEKEKQRTLNYINAHPEFCDQSPQDHDNCVKFCNDIATGQCTFEIS